MSFSRLFPEWSGLANYSVYPTATIVFDPSIGPSGVFRPLSVSDIPTGISIQGGISGDITILNSVLAVTGNIVIASGFINVDEVGLSGGYSYALQSGLWNTLSLGLGVNSSAFPSYGSGDRVPFSVNTGNGVIYVHQGDLRFSTDSVSVVGSGGYIYSVGSGGNIYAQQSGNWTATIFTPQQSGTIPSGGFYSIAGLAVNMSSPPSYGVGVSAPLSVNTGDGALYVHQGDLSKDIDSVTSYASTIGDTAIRMLVTSTTGVLVTGNISTKSYIIQNAGINPIYILFSNGSPSIDNYDLVLRGGNGNDDGSGAVLTADISQAIFYTGTIVASGTNMRARVTRW